MMYDKSHLTSHQTFILNDEHANTRSIQDRCVDMMLICTKVWCQNIYPCEEVYTLHHEKRGATMKAPGKLRSQLSRV
jgi:hypothetical protein